MGLKLSQPLEINSTEQVLANQDKVFSTPGLTFSTFFFYFSLLGLEFP